MVIVIRRLRRDEHGVASTVGTIMALLVFLTFLSLIVNQYVPVWMKDSEAAHMNSALGQFGSLKGAIDLQVLSAQMAQNAGSPFLPTTTSTAVTLGVDGFPIFSSPTLGTLSSFPDQGWWNVSFSYKIGTTIVPVWQNASGLIDLNVGNRYYIPEHIVYEDGAVIRAQSDGQIIRAPNNFLVTKTGNNVTLGFNLVNLYNIGGVTGTTTEVVNTKVFGVNLQTYTGLTSGLTILHTSPYGFGWYTFFNSTLGATLNPRGLGTFHHDFSSTSFLASTYSLWANYTSTTNIYVVKLVIKNGLSPLLTISGFTLQQAYVNVGIGEESNSL